MINVWELRMVVPVLVEIGQTVLEELDFRVTEGINQVRQGPGAIDNCADGSGCKDWDQTNSQ